MPYDDYRYSGGYCSSYQPTNGCQYDPTSPTRGRTQSYRRDTYADSPFLSARDRAKSPSTVQPIDSSSQIYNRKYLGIGRRSPPRFGSPPHRYRSPERSRYRPPVSRYIWERRHSPSCYHSAYSPKRSPAASPARSTYGTTTKTYGSLTPLYSTDKEAKYDVSGRDFHIYDYDGKPMASAEHDKDGERTWRLWDTDVYVSRNSDGDLEFYKRLADLRSN